MHYDILWTSPELKIRADDTAIDSATVGESPRCDTSRFLAEITADHC